jgi:hypothetical protein
MSFPRSRSSLFALTSIGITVLLATMLVDQIRDGRDRARVETELRREQEARIKELESTRARLEQEMDRLHASLDESSRDKPSLVPGRTAQQAAASNEPAAVAAAVGVNAGPVPQSSAADPEWMSNPIAHDMMRSHQREWLQKSSAELLETLDLSPEQAERYIELLVDGQGAVDGQSASFDHVQQDSGLINDRQRETDAALMALLGEEKFRTHEEYQRSAEERVQVDDIRRLFDTTPAPLAADQAAQLLAALVEERERAPPPKLDANAQSTDFMETYNQWADDHTARVRERAASVLTPEQFERFSEYQDLQDAMRRDDMSRGGMAFSVVEAQRAE